MDNKDFEELENDDLEEIDIEELHSKEVIENSNDFYNQNLNNQIRNIRKQDKGNQNAINRLRQRNANTMSKGVEAPESTPSTSNENDISPTNKLGEKLNPLNKNNGLSKIGKNTAKNVGQAAKEVGKQATKIAAKTASKALMFLITNPYFFVIVGVFLLVMIIPILWGAYDSGSGNSSSGSSGNSNFSNAVESMISLKRTNLSKDEFVAACDKYAKNDSKHKYFYDKCDEIYEISIDNNFNPEMVVIRAIVEGFSPGTSKNNYWGLGCYNGAGVNACITYSSFSEGVKGFINNVSQYDTVEEMMGKYAYIGNNWYNPGSSSEGGCYYFPYIKQYMSSGRIITVENACSENKKCSGTMCELTNDEDQLAYSKWQVSKMVSVGNSVFGSVTSQEATQAASTSSMPTSVADLKDRYYFIFDKDNYLSYETNNNHLFAQCVWYAYHRAMEIVDSSNLSEEEKQKRIDSLKSHSGDGGMYVTNMESAVFKKTTNINDIKAPAVISWKNNSYGHVAIIEEITKDSKGNKVFIVSEGWRTRDCPNRTWCTHNTLESLWGVTNFNSYTSNSINTYNSSYSFVNAASLLE